MRGIRPRIGAFEALLGPARNAATIVSAAWRAARDGATPPPPEPVLGRG
jgi:hypothetical protein